MDRDVRGQAARSSDPLRFVGKKRPIQVFLAPSLLGCVSLGFVFWLSRWLKLPPVAVCLIVAALMWCASSAAPSCDLMFPAYLRVDEPGVDRRYTPFPFVSHVGGELGSGFRVWPFWGDTEIRGQQHTRYVMWPFAIQSERLVAYAALCVSSVVASWTS